MPSLVQVDDIGRAEREAQPRGAHLGAHHVADERLETPAIPCRHIDAVVHGGARALAKEGYVALAVDLYPGKVATRQEDAHQLMMGTPPDQALRDLRAGFACLEAQPAVTKGRIGSIGWCMGGRYTLQLATVEAKLAAAVPYYGAPPTDAAAIAAIQAPVLAEEIAERVDEVDARLVDEQARVVAEERLAREVGVLGPPVARSQPEVDGEDLAERARLDEAFASRYQGCQRKFSCTMKRIPASRAASTTARLSSAVGASGFWQMTAIFRRAAARTIGRWVLGGVMMSTKSGLSRSSISSKSG